MVSLFYFIEDVVMDYDIPQDSVLDLLMFLIFVNDFNSISNNIKLLLPADDITITIPLSMERQFQSCPFLILYLLFNKPYKLCIMRAYSLINSFVFFMFYGAYL